MPSKRNWKVPSATGGIRALAQELAEENGIQEQQQLEIQRLFEDLLTKGIYQSVMNLIGVEGYDDLRYSMGESLGWDYDVTGWRKRGGHTREGTKGARKPEPDLQDVLVFLFAEGILPKLKHFNAIMLAITETLKFTSSLMSESEDVVRTPITHSKAKCLRYVIANQTILRRDMSQNKACYDHVHKHIGDCFKPGTENESIKRELRLLVNNWLNPWIIMDLSLPFRFIAWGYYDEEQKYKF